MKTRYFCYTAVLAELIPGARLVMMPAVSHGDPIQDPMTFHTEVIRLLDKSKKQKSLDRNPGRFKIQYPMKNQ